MTHGKPEGKVAVMEAEERREREPFLRLGFLWECCRSRGGAEEGGRPTSEAVTGS